MGGDVEVRQAELNPRAHEVDAGKAGGGGMASASAEGLPVFGEQQRLQFDVSPHAMRVAEHGTWRYLAVNDAALKLYGYTREEFLKLTLRDTRHPEEYAEQTASFAAHTGFLRHSGVRRHVKRSGEVIFVEVIVQDVLFEGRPARLSLTVDVTGRLRMQELLWLRQQEFESLAENLPDCVARFDRDHRYVYVNSAVEKLTGGNRSDMIGRTQLELGMPEDLVDVFERSFADVFGAGRSHVLEFRFPAPDGERFFEAYHVPERDAAGHVATVLCIARDITEKKRVEDELRRQKQLLETIIDNMPARVFARDATTLRYIMRNRFSDEGSGHVRGGAIGKTVYDLYPKEFADLLASTDREALKARRLVEVPELRVTEKSGEPRIRHVRKVPIFHANGDPWVIVGISIDITERKRVEQELRESNEFLRSMIESSRDCIKVLSLDGRLESMNQGGQRMLEIEDIMPLLNTSWLDFWNGDDRKAAARAVGAARKGNAGSFEGYCPSAKGTPKWWDVVVSPILDASGKPAKLLAISRDITRRKRVQKALRESEERFRQLAENVEQVFWINTLAGDNMIYVSPAYERIWGRSREALYRDPRQWMSAIHTEDLSAVQEGMNRQARGEGLDVEYRIVRPDGTLRWIKDRSYRMKAGDGSPLACGIAEDITGSKLAEQERLGHAILQRDVLVREVHHRIKNSLQGVAGLLRQKIRKYPAVAPGIEEAIAQLQSVALVYGLQETRPDGLIALAEIMNEVCASAESLTGGHVERTRESRSARPACVAGSEAVSVAVALNELVFNALKHQAGAGKKRAKVTLLESKDSAEIRVANRGRLPRGFDYPAGRGVGHGLGLVRTLLAAPGGSVAFNGGRNEVEVVLHLRPPLLAGRQQLRTR